MWGKNAQLLQHSGKFACRFVSFQVTWEGLSIQSATEYGRVCEINPLVTKKKRGLRM